MGLLFQACTVPKPETSYIMQLNKIMLKFMRNYFVIIYIFKLLPGSLSTLYHLIQKT